MISTRATSAICFSTRRCAVVAPTFPAPTTVTRCCMRPESYPKYPQGPGASASEGGYNRERLQCAKRPPSQPHDRPPRIQESSSLERCDGLDSRGLPDRRSRPFDVAGDLPASAQGGGFGAGPRGERALRAGEK